jgi:hypothetical protein
MATTIVTPQMIQDEETVALRDHSKKLEESLSLQERRLDDQRVRLEEERKRNHEKRVAEEEENRRIAKAKEEELGRRIAEMERKIKMGGGGGGALDPELIGRLKKLEEFRGDGGAGVSPDLTAKFSDIEKKLAETQRKLEEERKTTTEFFSTAPKEGPELEAWQKDMQIAWLMKANNDLLQKLTDTTSQIDTKIKEFSNMKFTGGGGGMGSVQKSGLSYAEINAQLAEIQAKLFDPNIDERESEKLNIDYEKLITELESTAEYQKEQDEQKKQMEKRKRSPEQRSFR